MDSKYPLFSMYLQFYKTAVIWFCAHSFLFGCMWKESVASVTTGLCLLRAGIYDIQSSYFCNKLYFMPHVSICLFSEGTDKVLCLGILTVDSCLLPLSIFDWNLFL
jgi:hypothetical protein